MNDLNKARTLLEKDNCTCVLIKGTKIYTSQERGVAPLLKFIDSGTDLKGFSVADKVVGKGAALLYVYMGIKELYAFIISADATKVLHKNNIALQYEKLVPHIINRKGDDTCPIEKSVSNTDNPQEAILMIKEKINSMKNG